MDSQPTPHGMALRQVQPRAQPSSGLPISVSYGATSFLTHPIDLAMLVHPNALLMTNPPVAAPCTQSIACQSCVYASPSQPCALHHAPIAYGQATSSYVASPAVQTTASQQQQVVSSMTQIPTAADVRPPSLHQTITSRRDSVELARQHTTLPPTISTSVRSMMRLKRPAVPSRVHVDAATSTRPPKLRRVASDGSREIQAVQRETVPQDSSASTSQLVTGPVPSSHPAGCHGCSPAQRCGACISCHCQYCPLTAAASHGAHHIVQPSASMMLPSQPQMMSMPQTQQTPQTQPTMGMRHVADSMNQMYAAAFYQNQQQQIHQASAAAVAHVQQLQAHHQQQQQTLHDLQQQQQQMLAQNQMFTRLISTTSPHHNLVFFPRNLQTVAGGRFELNMLVNVVPSDFGGDRPILDRHHMFAAPASEPQPVGLTAQEIDKCTEKMQFVKDGLLPEAEQERCTVCQCELETGEEVRSLMCSHQFHVGCIDRWLGYNKKCPVCRLDIDQHKAVLVE